MPISHLNLIINTRQTMNRLTSMKNTVNITKNHLATLLFLLLLKGSLSSQTIYPGDAVYFMPCNNCNGSPDNNGLFVYGPKTNFDNANVTSDYGPRNTNIQGASKFHLGLDFFKATQKGDAALSIQPGIVDLIKIQNTAGDEYQDGDESGLKYVVINSGGKIYGYLHFFENGLIDNEIGMRVGNFVLKKTQEGHWAIIDLINCRAISNHSGETITYSTSCTKNGNQTNTHETVKEIGADAPIGPIGTSSKAPVGPHLHLSYMESGNNPGNTTNSVDPWTVIEHPKTFFSEEIKTEHSSNWWKIEPKYAGNTKNTLLLKHEMVGVSYVGSNHYSNVCMNEEELEILVKNKDNSTAGFKTIEGLLHESKFIINPAGSKVIYPSYAWLTDKWGSPSRTGVDPHAYTGSSQKPYDNYYFADFYTRIHKLCSRDEKNKESDLLLAKYPWDARMLDGNYELMTRITNVRHEFEVTQNPLPAFKIDNFKPFVKGVNVYFKDSDDNVKIYERYWGESDQTISGIQLDKKKEKGITSIPAINESRTFEVNVLTSEPMASVTVNFPNTPVYQSGDLVATASNAEKTQWKVTYSPFVYLNQCYDLIIKGQDLNGNQLLDLPSPTSCDDNFPKNAKVPIRNGDNSWINDWSYSGQDKVHKFRLKECGSGFVANVQDRSTVTSCIEADEVSYDITYSNAGQANGQITLVVSGSHPRILVTWKNSLNEIIGTGLSISNLSSGIYCYEIRDDCCFISDCIEVGTCTLSATATPTHPSAPGLSNGSISIQVLNAVDPVSYIWSTGSTDNPIQNLPIGTYTVTVSDLYHCSAVKTVTLINCPSISVTSNASVVNPSACNTNDGRIRFLSGPFVAGGVGPYTFQWKDENNNILSNGASQLSNLVPGNYFIVATDVNGCTGSQVFNLIPNYYPNLEVSITNPCSGINNGKIDLVAYSNLGGTYNFEWDNGLSDIETNTSINDNLNQGTYCVDITSNEDGCVFTKCYDLISQIPPSALSVTSTFLVPCPRNNNGSISLTVSGGLTPYKFNWSDLNDLGQPEDRLNLSSGIYTVTITDFCGSTVVKVFDLTDISSNFTITQTIGCKPDVKGSATAVVTAGTPAYTYKWNISDTYYSQPTVNNLSPGTYSVTVTDSRGCTVSRTFVQKTRLFYTEITSACDGMNSGEILFKVFNPPPSSSYVKIEGDGIVLYENFNSGEEITFKMTNLLAGFRLTPKVTIGDCVINGTSPAIVTEKNKELRYVSYESGQCKFQEYCEGTLLAPNEYLYSDPTYEITPSGSFTSINTDATNVIDDFKEFIPFNKISLNSASSANLSNNIPGHDYNGLSFNVNYTNDNAGNLTFVINESEQTIDIWGTLTDSNETLLQYLSCVKYSVKKPNNTVTYSPFEFNSAKLPNFNLMLDSQQTQHNYQIGDTLAVMLYAAQFK